MGMYTGLKGSFVVKEELRGKFLAMLNGYYNADRYSFSSWYQVLGDHPWLQVRRNEFIPFGALSYMPEAWDDVDREYNFTTGEFKFACSLKNYEGEIGIFLTTVLPEIADTWYLEELYEEDDEVTIH